MSCNPALAFSCIGLGIAPVMLAILWTQQRCYFVVG
jgi:hypothetical protein